MNRQTRSHPLSLSSSSPARPAFDRELEDHLPDIHKRFPVSITSDHIQASRRVGSVVRDPIPSGIVHRDVDIPGYQGAVIRASIFEREGRSTPGPGIYFCHGGGMVLGNRFSNVGTALDWVLEFNAVCVSVEYRLAPEFPDPFPVEDCYAGLAWTAKNSVELGFDTARLILAGSSAGGGLAAGVALMARDRQGPPLLGQVLCYPMLDDRTQTVSAQQLRGEGVWDSISNDTGWDALLGDRRGTADVSIYAAPARATDVSDLPASFIDVGSVEVFRDEAVAYASALWAAGGSAELHVWPGGFHSFDRLVPQAVLSKAMVKVRTEWVGRLLASASRERP